MAGDDTAAVGPPPPSPPGAPAAPGPALIALCVVGFVVAGVVVGLGWLLLAPLPEYRVDGGRVLLPMAEDETAVGADGWFAACAAVAGILTAIAVYARVRAARLAALAVLTVGGLFAAMVAWRIGVALGPGAVLDEAEGLRDGARFDGPLQLGAKGVLFAWPLAAVVTYFALAFGLDPARPDRSGRRGRREPSPGERLSAPAHPPAPDRHGLPGAPF